MQTEIGKIASMLNNAKERKTPLQKSLDDFSGKLSIGIFFYFTHCFMFKSLFSKTIF